MSYSTPLDHLKTPPFSDASMSIQSLYPREGCIGDDQIWPECIQQFYRQGQNQSYPGPQWHHQADYTQLFDQETQRPFNSSGPALPAQLMNRPSMDDIPSFLFPADPRMVSPAPSQGLSTPTSSSARSPATDPDWYPDAYNTPQIHDDLPFPNDMSYMSPEIGTVCTVQPQLALFGGFPCVNISQVQTFSDAPDYTEPPENVFQPGERYLDLEQTEFAIKVDLWPSQTAIRRSMACSSSEQDPIDAGYIQEQDPSQVTTNMDGDIEEASDIDYTPKRSNRRRATHTSKSVSSSSVRRGRTAKSKSLRASKPSRGLSTLAYKSCKTTFNDPIALQCHVDKERIGAFTCVFNFAGCPSSFASKNEWKRHVATQHVNFNTWVCNLDACGKAHAESSSSPKKEGEGMSSKGHIFNRKDLFATHLHRIHALKCKPPDKEKAAWIKEHQKDCLKVYRQGPMALKCPVKGCETLFSGGKCWDDRMEHVAKHLEKVAEAASVQHENDDLLVEWAQSEGIIKRVGGVYKLIPLKYLA